MRIFFARLDKKAFYSDSMVFHETIVKDETKPKDFNDEQWDNRKIKVDEVDPNAMLQE